MKETKRNRKEKVRKRGRREEKWKQMIKRGAGEAGGVLERGRRKGGQEGLKEGDERQR